MSLEIEESVSENSIPEWHRHILQEREEKYNPGKAGFISWEELEKKMNEEDA